MANRFWTVVRRVMAGGRVLPCFAVLFVLLTTPAQAKKVALSIGIDRYSQLPKSQQLKKAVNDSRAMRDAFKGLGYQVLHKENVSQRSFNKVWQRFLNRIKPGDEVAFFYAGHAVELSGLNFLLPGDVENVKPAQKQYLKSLSLNFGVMMEQLGRRKPRLSLMVLDACRNNPFARRGRRGIGGSRGLSRVEPPRGAFVLYSAGAGEQALDVMNGRDKNRNSVFTRSLLPLLKQRGLTMQEIALKVRKDVYGLAQKVGHEQFPAYYDQLRGRFCPAGCGGALKKKRKEQQVAVARLENIQPLQKERKKKEKKNLWFWQRWGSKDKIQKLKKKKVAVGTFENIQPVRRQRKSYEPETVLIPRGTFQMGCVSGKGCEDDEKPVHRVTVSGFHMSKYETTFAQWDTCVKDGGCKHKPKDQGWGRGQRPVLNVSWDDANEYAKWLSGKTGQVWRLPTEAEWEYAARGGTKTPFSSGNTISANQANYDGNLPFGNGKKGKYRKKTILVGSFGANKFGLHDMHGNVWEWVFDSYEKYKKGNQRNPKVNKSGSARVIRGGGWYDDAWYLRSAYRYSDSPGLRDGYVGFRLMRQPS